LQSVQLTTFPVFTSNFKLTNFICKRMTLVVQRQGLRPPAEALAPLAHDDAVMLPHMRNRTNAISQL